MMPDATATALIAGGSAVLGGLVTAIASMGMTFFQTRSQARREMANLALEAARQELMDHRESAKQSGGMVGPLALYFYFNVEALKLAEAGRLTPAAVNDLSKRTHELALAFPQPTNARG